MILVTGGTGVVGSRVVQALLDAQQPVRILSRGLTDWVNNPVPQFRRQGVDIISGDICDQNKVIAAASGCTAIVHCASVMRTSREYSMDAINVEALVNMVAVAENLGIQRFIHLSCLGAQQYSNSHYLRTKWQAESIVKSSNFYWTIFRPSPIFASESHLTRQLDYWTSRLPFIPVVGSGLNVISPVSAEDVAACMVQSIYLKETCNQTYDLVGPSQYNLTRLMELYSLDATGKTKPVINIPSKLGYAVANMLAKFNPKAPLSDEEMKMLTTDLAGDPQLMKQQFQVKMLPLESMFRRIPAK